MPRDGEIPVSYRKYVKNEFLGLHVLEGPVLFLDKRGQEPKPVEVNARVFLGASVDLPNPNVNEGLSAGKANNNRFAALVHDGFHDVFSTSELQDPFGKIEVATSIAYLNRVIDFSMAHPDYPLSLIFAHGSITSEAINHYVETYKSENITTPLLAEFIASKYPVPKAYSPVMVIDVCNRKNGLSAKIESAYFQMVYRKGILGGDFLRESGTIEWSK